MLDNVFTLLSAAAPLALIILLWVMAQISRRFGEVTHRPPLYRGFYVAMVLMLFPLVVRLLAIGLAEDARNDLGGNSVEALSHDLPLALGITLGVIIAWRYWGWLVYAREGQSPVSTRR
jgi:hypothetical protein